MFEPQRLKSNSVKRVLTSCVCVTIAWISSVHCGRAGSTYASSNCGFSGSCIRHQSRAEGRLERAVRCTWCCQSRQNKETCRIESHSGVCVIVLYSKCSGATLTNIQLDELKICVLTLWPREHVPSSKFPDPAPCLYWCCPLGSSLEVGMACWAV